MNIRNDHRVTAMVNYYNGWLSCGLGDKQKVTPDEATELRCADCNGVFLEGKVFYLLGSVRPSPTVTVNDEITYEYDSGDLCQVCYNYRMELLKRPTTRYYNRMNEVPV